MAAKRPSLAESMSKVRQAPVQVIETTVPVPVASIAAKEKPASREGMKRATALLSPDEHRRLKRLSVDSGDSIEALLHEAITDLLQKRQA